MSTPVHSPRRSPRAPPRVRRHRPALGRRDLADASASRTLAFEPRHGSRAFPDVPADLHDASVMMDDDGTPHMNHISLSEIPVGRHVILGSGRSARPYDATTAFEYVKHALRDGNFPRRIAVPHSPAETVSIDQIGKIVARANAPRSDRERVWNRALHKLL